MQEIEKKLRQQGKITRSGGVKAKALVTKVEACVCSECGQIHLATGEHKNKPPVPCSDRKKVGCGRVFYNKKDVQAG
jgi:hypothetical protein